MLASYCGNCGKPFQSTDRFCAGCGTPRDDTNVSNTTLASAPNAPTVLSSPAPLGRTPQAAESVNILKAPAAVCELEIGGQICGVQAVGRCTTCGRAFCATHQAWNGQTYYLNQCAPCLAKAQADEEKRRQEAAAKHRAKENEAREYIQSGSARTALLTAGVQPVNIYQTQRKEEKKGLFGRYQWVEVVTSVRHGWVLGPFHWDVGEYGARRLTALLDLDQVEFTWVTPYLESYKELGVAQLGDDRDICKISKYEILEVAEAIKRLIELNRLGVQSIFTRRLPAKHDNPPSERQVLAGRSGFLRIEEGEEPGRIYEIHKEAFLIGNFRKSDINLTRTGNVSTNEHAIVMNLGNGNYALRASSEVKINGQKLDEDQLYPLQEGDCIQVRVFLKDQLGQTGLLESQTVLVFGTK
jgi:hypothetical protein